MRREGQRGGERRGCRGLGADSDYLTLTAARADCLPVWILLSSCLKVAQALSAPSKIFEEKASLHVPNSSPVTDAATQMRAALQLHE
jgi:hypothetical protein